MEYKEIQSRYIQILSEYAPKDIDVTKFVEKILPQYVSNEGELKPRKTKEEMDTRFVSSLSAFIGICSASKLESMLNKLKF